MIVERFVEACRRGLKVNVDKRKMIALGGEEGLEREIKIRVDGARMGKVSQFKYLGRV